MKTLEKFLERHRACDKSYNFAKDLTLKKFLETCERGDWILWLFQKTNPESLREIMLAKGHCANTVRHLMIDQHKGAIDTAIAFGEGRVSREELDVACSQSYAAAATTDVGYICAKFSAYAATAIGYAAEAADYAAEAAKADAFDYRAKADAALKQNHRFTADICRKYLPIEIWNQEQL